MRHRAIPAVALVSVLAALAVPVGARADVGVGGGYDAYSGPGGEHSGTALGYAAVSDRRASLALGALRFDDNLVGNGYGGLGVAIVPVNPNAKLRAWAMRYVGTDTYRAWRLKGGPEFQLGDQRTLGLYLLHDESNLAGVSNGGTAELGFPLAAKLTGRASGGMASLRDSPDPVQGTLGVSWQPHSRLELTADAGLARNGAITEIPARHGHGGPLGLPVLGSPGEPASQTTTTRTEGLFSAGIRVTFP